MPRKKSFVGKIWSGEGALEPFLVHIISDGLKTVCLLCLLWGIWEFISLMRFRHVPDKYLEPLEQLHFAGTYCVLVVTSLALVLGQVMELWKKTREP